MGPTAFLLLLECTGQTEVPEMWFKSGTITAPDGTHTEAHIVTCFFMSDRADAISAMPEAAAIEVAVKQVSFNTNTAKHCVRL